LNEEIIDIGCVDGWLTKSLRNIGFNCIGIEPNLEKWKNKECDYIKRIDIDNSLFDDKEFDCSILIEVIEHLPREYIKEIERITRKKILISTHAPNIQWLIDTLVFLHIINQPGSPELTDYKIDEIPFRNFKCVKLQKYFLLDQFAVFLRNSG
jgi:2-polyprenyl-3-methyl-5-hydroxy-6-metoxy-1,4-benzoquinol methylase